MADDRSCTSSTSTITSSNQNRGGSGDGSDRETGSHDTCGGPSTHPFDPGNCSTRRAGRWTAVQGVAYQDLRQSGVRAGVGRGEHG